jgi:DNA repair ATPase RecN
MPSRLISLSIRDFKRLSVAFIPIKDGLNKVVGANGAGKSSALDALAALLSGREIPDEPIRTGAESSEIIGEFSDMIVTRRISKSGTTLVITNKDKTSKFANPQAVLDKMTGGAGSRLFDPSRFIKESDNPDGRRAQAEQLRKLVGLDFAEIDQQKAALVSARQVAWSAANDAEATAKNLPTHADAPAEEVSSGQILSEIDKANEANRNITVAQDAITRAATAVTDHNKQIDTYQRTVDGLKQQLAAAESTLRSAKMAAIDLKDKHEESVKAHSALSVIDTTPLKEKLSAVDATNSKVRDNKAKAKADADAKTKRAKADDLQAQIVKLDESKAAQMKAVKYPIDGLSFDETGVRYKGKPFTQASDAEKLTVAVAIYSARNPEIRAMILRLGSLLDDASLELLNDLAEKHQLQVLLEIVQHGDEDYPAGAIVIENGEVKTA